MQIQRFGWKVKGFRWLSDYAARFGMENAEAKHKHRILTFWEKHGLLATLDAFKVSCLTLYHWRKQLSAQGGNIAALCNKSRAPRQRRQ